jgi:hypothetical protein
MERNESDQAYKDGYDQGFQHGLEKGRTEKPKNPVEPTPVDSDDCNDDGGSKALIDYDNQFRHDPVQVQAECDCCREPTVVDMCWWEYHNEKVNDGKPYWKLDELDELSVNDRCCPSCLDKRLKAEERNRELLSDSPPAWFDPANAGESWHENDY